MGGRLIFWWPTYFSEAHKRKPSEAEIFRFRSFKKKNKKNRYVVGYDSHPNEVSGGLPSW